MKIRASIRLLAALALLLSVGVSRAADPSALKPIPEKLVVLTFDDSVKSQAAFVAPLLKRLGFGATFFITEGFTFNTDKTHYMTWEEIAALDKMGFEIGNHTRAHKGVAEQSAEEFLADLEHVEKKCAEHGIAIPTTFAYPGNSIDPMAIGVLEKKGYKFARRGGAPEFPYKEGRGRAYEPGADHPLLIPSAGDARPFWTIDDFKQAISAAQKGKIAVLQFHGVPDIEHPWVNCDPKLFEACMAHLKENGFTAVALRDLAGYVDPAVKPADPFGAIKSRTPPSGP